MMPTALAVEHQRRLSELAVSAAVTAERLWYQVEGFRQFYENWEPIWQGFVAASFTDAVVNIQSHMLVETGVVGPTPVAPDNVNDWSRSLRGLENGAVYYRPFEIAATRSFDEGLFRLRQLAETDVQMASRLGEYQAMGADTRIAGYRRVLGAPPNCGLCIVASTRTYRKSALKPIHTACKCGTEPIRDAAAAAPVVQDADLLEQFKSAFPEAYPDGQRLRKIRVGDEGLPETGIGLNRELGPVLYDAAHDISTLTG